MFVGVGVTQSAADLSFASFNVTCNSLSTETCGLSETECISNVDVSPWISDEEGGSLYINVRQNNNKMIGDEGSCMHMVR